MTYYQKSSFWSNSDSILYAFIVFGGSLIFGNSLQSIGLSIIVLTVSFGLYFGVNVLTKKQLYASEIGLDLGLNLDKKELQVGTNVIKFKLITNIKFWYIYRIGWKMVVETKKQKLAVISPDVKVVVMKLKEELNQEVFN